MATIQNYISLRDGVSPAFEKMSQAADSFANRMNRVSTAASHASNQAGIASEKFGGLRTVFGGALLANIAAAGLNEVKNTLTGLIATADQYTGINARLKLVAGSQANAVYLNNEIYESALRARAGYMETAQAVSQLAMSAKDAFPDPREAVKFAEGINKLFTIGGTSGENKKFAMLQLTQGMASGQLQGDEFRSIAENAPIIENMIAKTMGVARSELKQLASEGKITADVIKRAVLDNMDEIDEQFHQMPLTWGDQWTWFKNHALKSFAPVLQGLNDLANSDAVRRMVDGAISAIDMLVPYAYAAVQLIGGIVNNIVYVVGGVYDFLTEHSWIVTAALGAVSAALLYMAILGSVNAAAMVIAGAATAAKAIADWAETAALLALTLAQDGLNAALYACPLTWIIGLIIGLIATLYIAVAVVNYFAGTNISATGIIFAAFAWLYAKVRNMVALAWNMFAAFANFLGNVFNDPLDAIANLFIDIWNGIQGYVAEAINNIIDMIAKIPGIGKVISGLGHVSATQVAHVGAYHEYIPAMSYADSSVMAAQAYDAGANISLPEMPEIPKPEEYDASKIAAGAAAAAKDPNAGKNAKNHDKTAKNTQKIADKIDMSDEEINELRDTAMADTLQQWQNQHIVVNVNNENTIGSDMDLDGVIDDMVKGFRDAITVKDEGVTA